MNLNKIQLIGRVTKDPEAKTTQGGTLVVKLGVATNYSYKEKSGMKNETTQFHNCVAWGNLADIINKYIQKGQEIYICGRMEYRQWEDKQGIKRTSSEIVVEDMQMGAKPNGTIKEKPLSLAGDDDIRPEDIF